MKLQLNILAPLAGGGHKGAGVPKAPPVDGNGGGNPLTLHVEEPPEGLLLVGLLHRIRQARYKLHGNGLREIFPK